MSIGAGGGDFDPEGSDSSGSDSDENPDSSGTKIFAPSSEAEDTKDSQEDTTHDGQGRESTIHAVLSPLSNLSSGGGQEVDAASTTGGGDGGIGGNGDNGNAIGGSVNGQSRTSWLFRDLFITSRTSFAVATQKRQLPTILLFCSVSRLAVWQFLLSWIQGHQKAVFPSPLGLEWQVLPVGQQPSWPLPPFCRGRPIAYPWLRLVLLFSFSLPPFYHVRPVVDLAPDLALLGVFSLQT